MPRCRGLLGAPEWTTQLMILDCPRIRAGALPAELAGLDPLSDAFPHAQPTGAELVALTRLRAIARRLAGALRLIPGGDNEDPVLVEPSPEVSASLTVYAPVWLGPEDLVAVLQPVAPEVTRRAGGRSAPRRRRAGRHRPRTAGEPRRAHRPGRLREGLARLGEGPPGHDAPGDRCRRHRQRHRGGA